MTRSIREKTGEEFQKRYKKLVKSFSLIDLKDMLSILIFEPKIVIGQINAGNLFLDKLSKKEQDAFRNQWSKLSMFDKDRYEVLMDSLEKKFDIFTEEAVGNEFFEATTFPKVPLLVEVVQSQINFMETGQIIPNDLKIKKIECFTSQTSQNDYKIVINEDYSRPISVSKNIKTWRLFIELVENGYLAMDSMGLYLYDYLNFNPDNRITKRTKYPLQVIIEQRDNQYVPAFAREVATEKALIQRQTKLKNST
jgi:hypothetical protein